MRVLIHENFERLNSWTAQYIASKINAANPSQKKPFILGLPTGSSPIGIYKNLVDLYNRGKVSFQHVVTFNMDEYIGIPEEHPESCHYFMYYHLFSHIDIPNENIHILDGNSTDLLGECNKYEQKIANFGGINLFVGGVGVGGNLAFNEPGSSLTSRTRIKSLTYDTLLAKSKFFGGEISRVPKTALTIGIGTLMDADEVLIIANGYSKSHAMKKGIEEGVNHMWTISMLQLHKQAIICCDDESTMELKVGTVKYFKDIESQALNNIPEL